MCTYLYLNCLINNLDRCLFNIYWCWNWSTLKVPIKIKDPGLVKGSEILTEGPLQSTVISLPWVDVSYVGFQDGCSIVNLRSSEKTFTVNDKTEGKTYGGIIFLLYSKNRIV